MCVGRSFVRKKPLHKPFDNYSSRMACTGVQQRQ